jgi:hypothetical protein
MNDNTITAFIHIAVWSFLCLAIMALRLFLRKARRQQFDLSDYFTMAAIAGILARLAVCPVVLAYGNNNNSGEVATTCQYSQEQVDRLVIGSKLTLVDRMVFIT